MWSITRSERGSAPEHDGKRAVIARYGASGDGHVRLPHDLEKILTREPAHFTMIVLKD